ncbi:MnhB domain-containing protein [Novosphingopyxis iocasae]|uniref:MnhB domain-containing protein n=1 Tax=Novosphingopyxis iocasae TaxID=2762729 RepID=UPI001651569C|nr:MnhB domain-containing protein [Novosphingopyxis iocasae]
MNAKARLSLLFIAFALLLPGIWSLAHALPPFGFPTELYGQAVNDIVPGLRHVANMITAVNFDVRGIDTVGEEMMLVGAVTGTVMLLRGSRGEDASDRADQKRGRPVIPRSDALVLMSRLSASIVMMFGIYIVAQGTETPGGGFQAGVLCATSFILIYLGDGYAGWRRLIPSPVMAFLEGTGGFVFVAAAAFPLFLGKAALENIIPTSDFRSMISGGMMILGNFAVTVAVAGSFGALMVEFMEETREPSEDDPAEGDGDEVDETQ